MIKVFLLALFLQISLQADQIKPGNNDIQVRSTLKMDYKSSYPLEVFLPKSMSKERITRALIEQQINFNGFTLPVKGYLHTFPSITIAELSDILFDLKFRKYLFEEGILAVQYSLDRTLNGQSVKVTLSTEPYAKIYQCPLPETITVQDKQETGLVLIQSVPECTALGLNQDVCNQYVSEYYCARQSLKASDKKGLYYQESTYGQLHNDETDQHKGPMHFKIISYKESDKIYTYDLEARFGDANIDSILEERNLISNDGQQMTHPDKVSKLNRGFAVDSQNRPIDHHGLLIIPPCSSMNLEMINQNLLRVECTYGDNPDPADNIILERIIAHRIDLEKSTLVDFAGFHFSNCAQALQENKKIKLSCTDKDGKRVAPPIIVCEK